MFNPVILAAIFIQWIVSRYSRKTSAIIGYIITTGILVWGLFIYSAGDEIAFLGFTLSLPVFIIACLVWYGLDTVEFMSVREREARLKAVLSQRELSVKTGISVSNLSRIESGKQKPTFRVRRALNAALGADIDFT